MERFTKHVRNICTVYYFILTIFKENIQDSYIIVVSTYTLDVYTFNDNNNVIYVHVDSGNFVESFGLAQSMKIQEITRYLLDFYSQSAFFW